MFTAETIVHDNSCSYFQHHIFSDEIMKWRFQLISMDEKQEAK